jgi:hypothetical protein
MTTTLVTLLNFACWGVCFWWMHRISTRQDRLLSALSKQGHRIEKIAKDEHELLREMHPAVEDIKEGVREVRSSVEEKV